MSRSDSEQPLALKPTEFTGWLFCSFRKFFNGPVNSSTQSTALNFTIRLMPRYVRLFVLLAVFSAQPSLTTAFAQTLPKHFAEDIETLKGLKGFRIYILVRSSSLDSTAIRTKVELKLRQNGILVGEGNRPDLTVNCVALDRPEKDIPALSCYVEVGQPVTLVIIPSITTWATTWTSEMVLSTIGRTNFNSTAMRKLPLPSHSL